MSEIFTMDDWVESRREIAARLCRIPSKRKIIKSTAWICKPDSDMSKAFLPEIIKHAGEKLNSREITEMLIEGCNVAIKSGKMDPADNIILFVSLTWFAQSLVSDPAIRQMVEMDLHELSERLRRQRKNENS